MASNYRASFNFPHVNHTAALPPLAYNMRLLLLAPVICLFALLFLPSLFPSADCSRLCPPRCVCYENSDAVDCRSCRLEHVPRGLPHGTWLLELGGNNLSEIGTQAFTGLWSLRVLVLTDSQIHEVQPQVGTGGHVKGHSSRSSLQSEDLAVRSPAPLVHMWMVMV